MSHRYKVVQLDVRKRRDYEPELERLLNEHAAAGWRLKELGPGAPVLPDFVVFERQD